MRGDIVFRVYGVHEGRAQDQFFGAYRTRPEAEAAIADLAAKEMHGASWAARYHDKGFVVREHVVQNDFEIPSRPKPRDLYALKCSARPNAPGTWHSTIVEVLRRGADGLEPVCSYERNHALYQTFEPFRQGSRHFALISRNYTLSAVLDLATGEVIAEETEPRPGSGFCPVGFYVPDWWDYHDGSMIPGSEHWGPDKEWPTGDFGFVWGCHWGDDSSWKVQYLDLSRVQDGIITREERFGYLEIADGRYVSPCFVAEPPPPLPSRPPDFIEVRRWSGDTRVRFHVEMDFDLKTGELDEDQRERLQRDPGS